MHKSLRGSDADAALYWLARMLADFGYNPSDFSAAVKAFQRHFRPARVNGRIDPETARRVAGLTAMVA